MKRMGMTIGEKIIANAAKKQTVSPGEVVMVDVDYMMTNDGTTHLSIDLLEKQGKENQICDPQKVIFICDHNVPSDSIETAHVHQKMQQYARAHDIKMHYGEGVCHQLMMEHYNTPGMLIIGADSHTCSAGALGAFGIGVGCTDFVYTMVTGQTWLMVPRTIRFNIEGQFRKGVYPRDLILKIMQDIGADGANYKIMEFGGSAIGSMSIGARMTLCNMAVEAGAKTALIEPDEKTMAYLNERGRQPKALFTSDEDAQYEKVYTYQLEEIEPMLTLPDRIDQGMPLSKWISNEGSSEEVAIQEAFIGSCNNGRIEDLRVAAKIMKGKKVKEGVRCIITPASRQIYLEALKEGLIEIFSKSGAMVMAPNCSVCWGACQGILGEDEVLISTGTRNFKGRAGHKTSKVYLASAATVAASAIAGRIVASDVEVQ